MDVLKKMDEVGIRPGVEAYNAVIAACAAAARPGGGGSGRAAAAAALPYNDTALRAEFVDKARCTLASDSTRRLETTSACGPTRTDANRREPTSAGI